jgi:hypothetical protein
MTDPTCPDRHDGTHEPITPAPRWVKVVGILAAALLLLVVILHLTGNSLGGPGSHSMPTGSRDAGGQRP